MREFWAGNDRYYPCVYCPCIVNNNGSVIKNDKISFPKISFFSQPDSGFGEKGVSHITVTDRHVYPNTDRNDHHLPTFAKFATKINGHPGYVSYRATLNTMVISRWRGSSDTPEGASWYIIETFTKPSNSYSYYVTFNERSWVCSESCDKEWNMGGTSGTDHSTLQMYREYEGKNLFKQYILTADQAERLYNSVAPQHFVPAGLVSELYRNAMNSITCNTNTIANIAEVIGIFTDIKQGNIGSLISDIPSFLKKKQFKKAASSSWLGYRYAYNTTKSDIQEYKNKLLPLLQQKTGSHIVRSGAATRGGVAHCKVVYTDRALNSVQQLYTLLKRTGLCLDAYNVWDMVPLSFVADWFLPIGDFLEDFSSNWVANTAMFDIETITTSWKWNHTIQDTAGWYEISHYSRDVTTEPPEFESYSEDPSTKTILKRIVDAGALIIG